MIRRWQKSPLSLLANCYLFICTLLLAVCATAQAGGPADPCSSPEVILQRYVDALGGKQVINNLHSRKAEADESEPYSFKPQDTAHYKYQFEWKAPNKVVAKFVHEERLLHLAPIPFARSTFVFDGSAWSDNRGRALPQRQQHDWRRRLVFDYPHNAMKRVAADPLMISRPWELYSNIKLANDFANDPGTCVVRAKGPDGRLDLLYFDATSGFLKRWELQMLQPRNSFYITFLFDDYRETDGIKFPFYLYIDYYKASFHYKKVAHNLTLADSDFELK